MILGIDTTTECLHLALVDSDVETRVWSSWAVTTFGCGHSVVLLPNIDDLLETASVKPSDLSGVVACVGPGGFTSLRVGVATAEGLALTGLPTWGYSAFQLRARAVYLASSYAGPIWVILDGQRQEVFMQLWMHDKPLMRAMKQSLHVLDDCVGSTAWWAPESFRARVMPYLSKPPVIYDREIDYTLASLASLCRDLPLGPPEVPLVPFYLREIDAEVNFPEASGHLSEALSRGKFR